ncbi:MAG: thioredoxin family protein [Rikenellaceae bacterium]|nr:thioredoxin family protein [Rikenellaceae bacterium]
MKKLFLSITVAALAFPSLGQGILFEELTLPQAIEKAQAENKLIFVDVYTDWCGPCKMMDAQVFPLQEVGDYFNPRFINLKMNAEVGEEGPRFANLHGVWAFPTFVILESDGRLRHMFAGGVLDLGFIDKVAVAFDEEKALGPL